MSSKPASKGDWISRMPQDRALSMLEARETSPGRYRHRGSQGGEGEFFAVVFGCITAAILILGTLVAYIFSAEWTGWHLIPTLVLAGITGGFAFLLWLGSRGTNRSDHRTYKALLARAEQEGWR